MAHNKVYGFCESGCKVEVNPAGKGRSELAEKLENARKLIVNLSSEAQADFDGTSDAEPGVKGILPVKHGGTGNDKGQAFSAEKLANARKLLVNLSSEAQVDFDGTSNAAPGVEGILPVKHGGHGAATSRGAEYNILGDMPESTNGIVPENNFVFRRAVPNTNDGVLVYKSASIVWEWIVAAMRETLGVHDVVYSATKPEYVEGRIWLKPVE